MIDPASLWACGLTFLVIAASPGPATLSNATIAMHHGRSASLRYGAGLSVGLVFWGLIAASGMGAVLQGSLLLPPLKILGGLYLLWLAFVSVQSARASAATFTAPPTARRWFLRGLTLNLSNPKSVLAWMAALSLGLGSQDSAWQVLAATSLCIAVGFAVNAAYSLAFSIDGMMRAYARLRRWIDSVAAALFLVAGIGLIRSAFSR